MSPVVLMWCSIVAVNHGYESDAMMMLSLLMCSVVHFLLMLKYSFVPHVVLFFVEVVDRK